MSNNIANFSCGSCNVNMNVCKWNCGQQAAGFITIYGLASLIIASIVYISILKTCGISDPHIATFVPKLVFGLTGGITALGLVSMAICICDSKGCITIEKPQPQILDYTDHQSL